MIRLAFHVALCLPLLACPAMGGWCCAEIDCEPTVAASTDCCEGCHHEQHGKSSIPNSPAPCHDCICTGALPPSTASIALQIEASDSVQANVSALASQSECKPRAIRDLPSGMTLSGQTMLRTYCAFLL